MEITAIDTVSRTIPFGDAFPVSYESHAGTEHLFVRVRTDTDHVGYGEGTALPWFTGDVGEGLEAVVDRYLASTVEGETLSAATATVREFIDEFPGAPGAKAAVEMALLDLSAKQAGVPLSTLLGSRIRESVPVTHVVPALSPSAAADRVADAAAQGFRSFKVKADGDVEGDVERIDAVTAALPDDGIVRVDANTGWRRYSRAKRVIDQLEQPDRIEYIEQPVATHRVDDMRRLWEATDIPVYADESFAGPDDVVEHPDAVAGCHLKLAKAGSLERIVEMGRLASRREMRVSAVSAFGTSLDAAANLHVAAVLDNLSAGAELCTGLIEEDPTTPSLPVASEVEIPSRPGIGVELDDELFETG